MHAELGAVHKKRGQTEENSHIGTFKKLWHTGVKEKL